MAALSLWCAISAPWKMKLVLVYTTCMQSALISDTEEEMACCYMAGCHHRDHRQLLLFIVYTIILCCRRAFRGCIYSMLRTPCKNPHEATAVPPNSRHGLLPGTGVTDSVV